MNRRLPYFYQTFEQLSQCFLLQDNLIINNNCEQSQQISILDSELKSIDTVNKKLKLIFKSFNNKIGMIDNQNYYCHSQIQNNKFVINQQNILLQNQFDQIITKQQNHKLLCLQLPNLVSIASSNFQIYTTKKLLIEQQIFQISNHQKGLLIQSQNGIYLAPTRDFHPKNFYPNLKDCFVCDSNLFYCSNQTNFNLYLYDLRTEKYVWTYDFESSNSDENNQKYAVSAKKDSFYQYCYSSFPNLYIGDIRKGISETIDISDELQNLYYFNKNVAGYSRDCVYWLDLTKKQTNNEFTAM